MAGNNRLDVFNNEKDTFPRSAAGTGTISAVNGLNKKIVGVGTSFTTEVRIKDWIYIPSEDELRQVESIVNDLELTVSEGFTGPVSGLAFQVTPKSTYRLISWVVKEGTTVLIDSISFAAGEGDSKDVSGAPAMSSMPDPILIDAPAAGDTVHVSFK
jgi:hypothetical protein